MIAAAAFDHDTGRLATVDIEAAATDRVAFTTARNSRSWPLLLSPHEDLLNGAAIREPVESLVEAMERHAPVP